MNTWQVEHSSVDECDIEYKHFELIISGNFCETNCSEHGNKPNKILWILNPFQTVPKEQQHSSCLTLVLLPDMDPTLQ